VEEAVWGDEAQRERDDEDEGADRRDEDRSAAVDGATRGGRELMA